MDKIDRIRKIISESSAAQEASKERAAADREKQREVLNKIKERKANRKKYVPQKPLEKISQAIKKAKFSKLRKVSDDGKKGATAVQKAAGNVIKGVGNIAKAGAKVARKGIKAGKVVGNEVGLAIDKTKLRKGFGAKSEPMKDKKREKLAIIMRDNQSKKNLTAKSMREQFIQEVENKKDKVDKVIDIMRGKNKIEINPDVKESVDKKKI